MSRRIVAIVALVIVAATALLWTVFARGGGVEVDAVRVRRGTLEVTLPVTGFVETQAAELAFELPGRLAEVRVREGDAVRAGQVLAALDGAEAAAAAAQAAAAADAARSEAVRARAAVETARQQAAQAEAAHRAAAANLRQVRAGARAEELRQARAAVEAADTARRQAQRNLQVTDELARQGAVAQTQVDAARAQAEAAEAQHRQAVAQYEALAAGARPEAVEAAAQQVRQAEAASAAARANVRQAEALASAAQAHARQAEAASRAAQARGRRVVIAAPFAGTVTRVYLHAGSAVAPGIPVVSLVSPGGWITAEVDEADIDAVRVGQSAQITADAYPQLDLRGRVTRIGGAVEIRAGSRAVRVRIDPQGPTGMRAGTSVDVGIVLALVPDALLVTLDAVQPAAENGESEVFVIERGILRRRSIRLGQRNEETAQVVAGLREGESVAVGDPALLREGARIRVRATR